MVVASANRDAFIAPRRILSTFAAMLHQAIPADTLLDSSLSVADSGVAVLAEDAQQDLLPSPRLHFHSCTPSKTFRFFLPKLRLLSVSRTYGSTHFDMCS